MTAKHAGTLLMVACLALAAGGCLGHKPTAQAPPHMLQVVDAVTKLPVVGADVKLTAPGMVMGHRTDERGMIDVGSGAFSMQPRTEAIEITKQGYNRVSFPLMNGLPPTVELAPVPATTDKQ